MAECNPRVDYPAFTVIYQDSGRDCQFQWCYQVIFHGGGKVPIPKPVGLLQANSVAIVIPLCSDLTSGQVTNRTVVGDGGFSTSVGLDPDTNIYGIRFDISAPFTTFTVCFRTPPRIPASQPLGLVSSLGTFTNQNICSPGCEPCNLQTRGFEIPKGCCGQENN